MYCSTLQKLRDQLPRIRQEGDWISQPELARISDIDIRTIRSLRKRGVIVSDTVRHNDIWISVDSIRRYCGRQK